MAAETERVRKAEQTLQTALNTQTKGLQMLKNRDSTPPPADAAAVGCATPQVGHVAAAPQVQLPPPPVLVQQTRPKPAGTFSKPCGITSIHHHRRRPHQCRLRKL